MSEQYKEFWTFIPQSLSISMQGLIVTGWFAYASIVLVDDGIYKQVPNLKMNYLTPQTEPVKLTLPQELLGGKSADQISPSNLVNILNVVFSKPFIEIPAAPINIPMHRTPPHRREALKKALKSRA